MKTPPASTSCGEGDPMHHKHPVGKVNSQEGGWTFYLIMHDYQRIEKETKMEFRFHEDNADPRYAGKKFRAAWGRFDDELQTYVPADEKGCVLIVFGPEYDWQPLYGWHKFGELTDTHGLPLPDNCTLTIDVKMSMDITVRAVIEGTRVREIGIHMRHNAGQPCDIYEKCILITYPALLSYARMAYEEGGPIALYTYMVAAGNTELPKEEG